MSEAPGKAPITWDVIKAHNTRKQCWMVIHKVESIRCFEVLGRDPGGEEVLVEVAGQDATEAFDEVGHSKDAIEMLGPMFVGDLAVEAGVAKEDEKVVKVVKKQQPFGTAIADWVAATINSVSGAWEKTPEPLKYVVYGLAVYAVYWKNTRKP
ncbi:hypothetical protein M427DRAFT_142430 [Gonapodya prolifera JEL478]|uniref:Cytochrome b5 heme-binding domain-containing protein n=1 Tax=Gonapodya prolifera (strain JEL478) TaxID=1344416 RepID=A0A139AXP3_GONPJ|nr:hypothetical protein M427DRAFT_142430 [Gonapodya prolifera JEL478]|eukprot:KXS21343.1 hypothetical protein M427DRAFT_142430 [Gonapodya prolifera JEL478]